MHPVDGEALALQARADAPRRSWRRPLPAAVSWCAKYDQSAHPARGAAVSPVERLMRDAATLGVALSGARRRAAAPAARGAGALEPPLQPHRHHRARGDGHPSSAGQPQPFIADLHGTRIADVGTGAGFPGLPLALVQPAAAASRSSTPTARRSASSHTPRALSAWPTSSALQARVEALSPDAAFDTVVARAFAPLPQLLRAVSGRCAGRRHARAGHEGQVAARRSWLRCRRGGSVVDYAQTHDPGPAAPSAASSCSRRRRA